MTTVARQPGPDEQQPQARDEAEQGAVTALSRSPQRPLVLGEAADAHHQGVGDDGDDRPCEQDTGHDARRVRGDRLGVRREHGEHEPRCGDGQPGRVDGPRLAGLELGPCARVLAQEAGEGAQLEEAEVAPADLAGDPQALDETVADGVGQPVLEPVEAVGEPSGEAVVVSEAAEGLAQLLQATRAKLAERLANF